MSCPKVRFFCFSDVKHFVQNLFALQGVAVSVMSLSAYVSLLSLSFFLISLWHQLVAYFALH